MSELGTNPDVVRWASALTTLADRQLMDYDFQITPKYEQ